MQTTPYTDDPPETGKVPPQAPSEPPVETEEDLFRRLLQGATLTESRILSASLMKGHEIISLYTLNATAYLPSDLAEPLFVAGHLAVRDTLPHKENREITLHLYRLSDAGREYAAEKGWVE